MELTTQTAPSGFTIVFNYTPAPKAFLQAKYVCSAQPYGFDLGADPDGSSEDVSNGQPCSSCANIGQTCIITIQASDDGTYCDPSSGQFGGAEHVFSAQFARNSNNYGKLFANADGTYTFLRTALGPVTVDEIERIGTMTGSPSKNGGVNCRLQWSLPRVSTTWQV
jgi:hypothetical protein